MAALLQTADAWAAAVNGFEFKIRPLVGAPDGPTLSENARYQISVKLPAHVAGTEVVVGGLPLEVSREDDLLLGILDTGHTFGQLSLEVHQGHPVAAATIEVRPRHLNVDADFVSLKSDLDRVSASLAYAIWRRTHQQANPDFTVEQGVPEWLAMLRDSWSRIRRSLRELAVDPNSELRVHHDVRRVEQTGQVDAIGMRWLARQPSAWVSSTTPLPVAHLNIQGRFATPARVLAPRRESTLDTPANRALKAALQRLESRLRNVLREIDDLSPRHFAATDKDHYVAELRRILRDLQTHTVHGFLAEVPSSSGSTQRIHAVSADARYRQIFRSLEVLRWGVASGVEGSVTQLSLKDTWELYEYWVYLFVSDLFAQWGWDCVHQGVLTVSKAGAPLLLDLARGERSETRFEYNDPISGEYRLVVITFHPTFRSRRSNTGLGRGALTVKRDVDILVEVEASGAIRRLVLDPKYRVERIDGVLACPLGGVDAMHVYRDAIGRWEPGAAGARHFIRTLNAAVAVFPSRDEAGAEASVFFESLADGVGALPLLPPDGEGPSLLPSFLQTFVS